MRVLLALLCYALGHWSQEKRMHPSRDFSPRLKYKPCIIPVLYQSRYRVTCKRRGVNFFGACLLRIPRYVTRLHSYIQNARVFGIFPIST
ncbi:hypothetical protein F4805DRAFT_160509 [Annulohypoxylon moriforme]|nr:hypothetical protein F4805DRAFT_160509 [Annulohypoxylon moriforme]